MTESIPSSVRRGSFLISSPEIEVPLFYRSVMLICEHNASGSFALLLNKPLDINLPDEVVNLRSAPNKSVSIRAGGPVQTNQMMLLHTSHLEGQQLLRITEGVYLGGDLPYLHEMLEDENSPPVFLCFGYAGWATGQLEREFLDGSWFTYPATKELIFDTPPEKLWRNLLMQMGGRYATLSTIPEDLSVN